MADICSTDGNPQADISLEERKFLLEKQKYDHERELETKKLVLQEKEIGQKRLDPLMVVVVGGIIAAFANTGVSYYTGAQQIELEKQKHENSLKSEKYKSEALRVSDATKSSDQVRNACQLNFLLEFALITDENLKSRINQFLRDRKGEEVLGDGSAGPSHPADKEKYVSICKIATRPPEKDGKNDTSANEEDQKNRKKFDNGSPSTSKTTKSEPAQKVLVQSLTFSTGWIGGGHSQSDACSQAIASYQSKFPGKILESAGASEQSRKDIFGHVTYNYFCKINVYDMAQSK